MNLAPKFDSRGKRLIELEINNTNFLFGKLSSEDFDSLDCFDLDYRIIGGMTALKFFSLKNSENIPTVLNLNTLQ